MLCEPHGLGVPGWGDLTSMEVCMRTVTSKGQGPHWGQPQVMQVGPTAYLKINESYALGKGLLAPPPQITPFCSYIPLKGSIHVTGFSGRGTMGDLYREASIFKKLPYFWLQ